MIVHRFVQPQPSPFHRFAPVSHVGVDADHVVLAVDFVDDGAAAHADLGMQAIVNKMVLELDPAHELVERHWMFGVVRKTEDKFVGVGRMVVLVKAEAESTELSLQIHLGIEPNDAVVMEEEFRVVLLVIEAAAFEFGRVVNVLGGVVLVLLG